MNEFVDLKIGNAFNKCTVLRLPVLQKKIQDMPQYFQSPVLRNLNIFM